MINTKTKPFTNFCVIDIETKGLSARPESFVFGCLYSNEIKKVFYDRKEMVNYLLSAKNKFKYIFAHNAEFDFTILFDNIILNLDNSALFVGSTFVQAKKNKKIFSNSLPVLKSSVMELGKSLGAPKGETPQEYINWKNGDPDIVVKPEHVEYCYNDCYIVYEMLQKVYEVTGKIKPTIASCSMEVFKKKFLVRPLKKNPHNEKFRDSYYGGRVECFRFGKIKPCYKYDVNSLYPYVCTKMFFPDFNTLKKGRNNNIKYFNSFILPNYEGSVSVTVEHQKNFIGVLPLRRKHEIIYPYGIFTARYNFNELRFALSTGLVRIKKIHDYVYARKIGFTELKEYMLYFYGIKSKAVGSEYLIAKFFMNALSGKFAQKDYGKKTYFTNLKDATIYRNEQERIGNKCEPHHFSKEREDMFIEVFEKQRKRKINWNIPTVSSYITSQARIHMLPFFLKYQKHVLYTDTDSLVMDIPLKENIISDTILGHFKKEHDTEITIIGNKHYSSKIRGRNSYHIKGVGRNFKRKGKNFTFNKMIRTKEALSRKLHAGMFVEVVKHLASDYTKRKVNGVKTLTLQMK